MRLSQFTISILGIASAVNAVSIPDSQSLALYNSERSAPVPRTQLLTPDNALEKRKGGGGKGGGGGGGGGGKSGGKSGGSSNSGGKTSPSSNLGGQTKAGSGVGRAYGGGGFYGGGAAVPYAAGQRTPKGLLAGALLLPAAALLLLPGLWLWPVFPYHYTHPITFLNQTVQNATNGLNQTLPVTCLCQQYSACGCDDNSDAAYIKDLVGNGSYAALNKTLVTVSDVDGNRTLVLNGTLANGTTAPGGTDSAAPRYALNYSGYWIMAAVVLSAVFL